MATLCLDIGSEVRTTPELYDWLAGDWGLLFSHPEDFQYQGPEPVRQLDILRDQFRICSVRPIAVMGDDNTRERSWVDELQQDWGFVRLREPSAGAWDPVSVGARALCGELLTLQPRYVLIVDSFLKHRAVLRYAPGRCTVSTLDLLTSIDALRHGTKARYAA
jgi:alkyl hydroperoxide reductase subunit AhpC